MTSNNLFWPHKPLMIEPSRYVGLTTARLPAQQQIKSVAAALPKGLAVIPIHGVLTKRSGVFDGFLGTTSYETIQTQFATALADETIDTILLDVDSPGGETSGLFDLADFIYEARSQKRIWAVANDDAYSAAYALASSASTLFINRTSGVGSIGVIATHVDQSSFDEKQGVKYTTVFAGNRKNDLNPHEPMTCEALQGLQSEIDRLYGLFVDLVSRNRGLSPDAVRATEAGLLSGEDAIQCGLADAWGTLGECIQKGSIVYPAKRITAMTEKIEIEKIESLNTETLINQGKILGRTQYQVEVLELSRLCQLSRRPEQLATLIEQNMTLDQAREHLLATLAAASGPEIANAIPVTHVIPENPLIQAAKTRAQLAI